MSTITFDSTILGGLPVEVEARICPAEPDVGIFRDWAEIEDIRFPSRLRKRDNKRIKGAALPERIAARLTDRDHERLEEDALEAAVY
jgi:hypothetical protein